MHFIYLNVRCAFFCRYDSVAQHSASICRSINPAGSIGLFRRLSLVSVVGVFVVYVTGVMAAALLLIIELGISGHSVLRLADTS